MKSHRSIILLVLLVLLGGVAQGASSLTSDAIVTARTEVWQSINAGRAASAAVAIMQDGQVIYVEGFGMADREQSIPVTADTIFNIGSISKVYVATAIMLLVDEGRVALDAPVTTYLPEFVMADPRYKEITVRMLLNHASGLPGTVFANSFGYAYNDQILNDTLQVLSRSTLRHDPGAMAIYTNDGFTLAEMIVERVSGHKYADFLAMWVFAPLALEHTGVSVGERKGESAAAYYHPQTGKREPLEAISLLGAGGLSSTAVDLVRFADSFSAEGQHILSPAALAEMLCAQPTPFSEKLQKPTLPFGLGWDLTDLPRYQANEIKVLGKSGGTLQYSSMLFTVPQERLSVAVTISSPMGSALQIALDVLDALLVERGLMPPATHSVTRPLAPEPIPPEYVAYTGYYAGESGQLYDVAVDLEAQVVNIATYVDGAAVPIGSLYYHQGYLHFPGDSASQVYFIGVDGNEYLATSSSTLGTDGVWLQKLKSISAPVNLEVEMHDQLWLRRNVSPYEGMILTDTHIVRSSTYAQLPGYIDFSGIKEVRTPSFAGVPVAAMRDQNELTLTSYDGAAGAGAGGSVWVWASDMLYSSVDAADSLTLGENSIAIGNRGYSQWLLAADDAILSFELPDTGRVIVFSPDGSPVYDSVVDEGDLFVEQGSYIELIGISGDEFGVISR